MTWKELMTVHPGLKERDKPSYRQHSNGGGWIGRSSSVSPDCLVEEDCFVGEYCVIEQASEVTDASRVGNGSRITASRISGADIRDRKVSGPIH